MEKWAASFVDDDGSAGSMFLRDVLLSVKSGTQLSH